MFAIHYPDQTVYLMDYQIARNLRNNGVGSVQRDEIFGYGRTLDDWLEEMKVEAGETHGCRDWV